MNKKGQGGTILFIIIILLILIGSWFSSTNPQKSFMNDCKDLYKDDFLENDTCGSTLAGLFNDSSYKYECQRPNWNEVEKFCLDKYSSSADSRNLETKE